MAACQGLSPSRHELVACADGGRRCGRTCPRASQRWQPWPTASQRAASKMRSEQAAAVAAAASMPVQLLLRNNTCAGACAAPPPLAKHVSTHARTHVYTYAHHGRASHAATKPGPIASSSSTPFSTFSAGHQLACAAKQARMLHLSARVTLPPSLSNGRTCNHGAPARAEAQALQGEGSPSEGGGDAELAAEPAAGARHECAPPRRITWPGPCRAGATASGHLGGGGHGGQPQVRATKAQWHGMSSCCGACARCAQAHAKWLHAAALHVA